MTTQTWTGPFAPRVVLDTTVIVSAVRSRNGASAACLDLAVTPNIKLLMDYKIGCEYRAVALRPHHVFHSTFDAAEIEELIASLEAVAESINIVWRHRPLSSDPDDDLILDLAINGHANLIVSSNVRHLRLAARPFRIEVMEPREFLFTMSARGKYGTSR